MEKVLNLYFMNYSAKYSAAGCHRNGLLQDAADTM
jgi:hypothetical protein